MAFCAYEDGVNSVSACLGCPGNVLPTSFSISEYTSSLTPCDVHHIFKTASLACVCQEAS